MTDIAAIIKLTGNKRIPHLEAEIFADSELTCVYLSTLCGINRAELNYLADRQFIECLIYRYSVHIMNARWAAAEHLLGPSHYSRVYKSTFL